MPKTSSHRKSSSKAKADALFTKASEQWDRGKHRSAFRLFLAAAKHGDVGAFHNLGYFYDVGIGVKPNRAAALQWYKRAFRRGTAKAASNIGTMYRDERNTKEALSWFKRATQLGNADANLEIAKIYLRGNGDSSKAKDYLRRTVNAKATDVTNGSRDEARRLLKRLGKSSYDSG